MPYKKTYRKRVYRKRKPGNKFTGYNRYRTYARTWKQIKYDVASLKNLINVEFKMLETASTATPNTTGTLALLNATTKGDDISNREGRQIRIKSIQLYLRSNLHASATATSVRCIIFIDKQPNATAATYNTLLDVTTPGAIDAMRNLDYRKRYTILKDLRIKLNTNQPEKTNKWYRTLDMKTIYDDSDVGTIADITTNSLYAYFVSDEATNTPSVIYVSRIRFIDN